MRLSLGLGFLAVAAMAPVLAYAAGAPAPARAAKLTGYPVDVVEEVMMQNLNCDEINRFRTGMAADGVVPLTNPNRMLLVAETILDEPGHEEDTSRTLFGGALTNLILSASNSPGCDMIVPQDYPPGGNVCQGTGASGIPDVSLNAQINNRPPPLNHPGELKLIGLFDIAAKQRNCSN